MSGESEYDDHNEYDGCPHCDDEGFTFDCIDGQCLDYDIGCDLCTRPCPYCSPQARPSPETVELRRVLGDALNPPPPGIGDKP